MSFCLDTSRRLENCDRILDETLCQLMIRPCVTEPLWKSYYSGSMGFWDGRYIANTCCTGLHEYSGPT